MHNLLSQGWRDLAWAERECEDVATGSLVSGEEGSLPLAMCYLEAFSWATTMNISYKSLFSEGQGDFYSASLHSAWGVWPIENISPFVLALGACEHRLCW